MNQGKSVPARGQSGQNGPQLQALSLFRPQLQSPRDLTRQNAGCGFRSKLAFFRKLLDRELAAMISNLKNTAKLLRACYGETDITVLRAEEAGGAVQRLVWAVERRNAKQQHASGYSDQRGRGE